MPLPGTERYDRVKEYEIYDAPEVERPDDHPDAWIVSAEHTVPILFQFERARILCWWLSIDFSWVYIHARQLRTRPIRDVKSGVKFGISLVFATAMPFKRRRMRNNKRLLHATQSEYAAQFLQRDMGIQSRRLSDYISNIGRLEKQSSSKTARQPVIAYNPAKGQEWTARVIARAPAHWHFLPLVDMSKDEFAAALGRSSIYLDLGFHPGKDRIPREAALAGAVVVVARRGSAAFQEDMPLPERFKIELVSGWEQSALQLLTDCLERNTEAHAEQEPYRAAIRGERDRFDEEVSALFGLPAS